MATYNELANIRDNPLFGDFRDKIVVAVAIKGVAYIQQTPPDPVTAKYQNEIAWALEAVRTPVNVAEDLLYYVIAAVPTATVNQILTATDAVVQNNVNDAVDAIIAGTV